MNANIKLFGQFFGDLFDKLFFIFLISVIAFAPAELYFLVKYFLSPEGFWQNLILLGISVYILGFIQLILFIFWVIFLFLLWREY